MFSLGTAEFSGKFVCVETAVLNSFFPECVKVGNPFGQGAVQVEFANQHLSESMLPIISATATDSEVVAPAKPTHPA